MKVFKRFLQSIIAASLLASFILAPALPVAAHGDDDGQKQVVGYFIQWGIYGRNYLVKNIVDSGSADKLTVINYAFGNVAPNDSGQVVCKLTDEWADYQKPWEPSQSVDGNLVTWPNPILGNFQQLKLLKGLYPNIRVVITLGGWTLSKYFSDAALTPESRARHDRSVMGMGLDPRQWTSLAVCRH